MGKLCPTPHPGTADPKPSVIPHPLLGAPVRHSASAGKWPGSNPPLWLSRDSSNAIAKFVVLSGSGG